MKIQPLAFITIAALCAASVQANAQEDFRRTVTVRGTGTVTVRPDQVRLWMQVMTRGSSASSAMSEASGRTNEVLLQLQAHGVEEKDVQTKRVSVSPEYDREKRTSPPTISGYVAQSEFSALFRQEAIDRLGRFLDKAVAAGVTNIGGMNYETSERSALEQRALGEAAKDARIRAEKLAAQLGAKVGQVLSVAESGLGSPGPRAEAMAMSDSGSPVMMGEMDVVARVEVVFELVPDQN